MKTLEHHALSNIFPMMTEEQFNPFLDGMKRFGYDETKPVVMYEGKILDGRHRNKAACLIGIEAPTKEFIPNGVTPLDFVIQQNLNRRHLNTSQLGIISLSVYDALREQFLSKKVDGTATEFKDGMNRNRAVVVSKMFGVGRSTVTYASTIRKYAPHLIPRIMSGEINLAKALKLMPKIRSMAAKREKDDKIAVEVLKTMDPSKFIHPTSFDSYEKFFGEHLKKMNDAGYMMQAVFCARKVYVQIVKNGSSFRPWGNSRNEYDFRLAATGVMKDFIK